LWLRSILAGGLGAGVFGALYSLARMTLLSPWLALALLSGCLAGAQLVLLERWIPEKRRWVGASLVAGTLSTLVIMAVDGGASNDRNAAPAVVAFAAYLGAVAVGQSVAWRTSRRFALSWAAAGAAGGAALGFALFLATSIALSVPESISNVLSAALLSSGGGLVYGGLSGVLLAEAGIAEQASLPTLGMHGRRKRPIGRRRPERSRNRLG
jgi:hypothetical protein